MKAFTEASLEESCGAARLQDDYSLNLAVIASRSGYITDSGGNFWQPSAVSLFLNPDEGGADELQAAQARFFTTIGQQDAFGNTTTQEHDQYTLLVTSTKNALGQEARFAHDYRVLALKSVIDINMNQTLYAFDVFGDEISRATISKDKISSDLVSDLARIPTEEELAAFLLDPTAQSEVLSRFATSRVLRDHTAYERSGGPAWEAQIIREMGGKGGPEENIYITISYLAGDGRLLLRKLVELGTKTRLPRWLALHAYRFQLPKTAPSESTSLASQSLRHAEHRSFRERPHTLLRCPRSRDRCSSP